MGKHETFQYTKVRFLVLIASSDTDLLHSILRVRWSSCMLSCIDLMMPPNDSCKTLEMH